MVNPYQPNQPVTPASFAGRSDLIARVAESVDLAEPPLRRSTSILLYGGKGSGKTSAIRKIRSLLEVRIPELVGIEIQLLAAGGDEALIAQLLDNLRAQPGSDLPFWPRARKMLGRVSAVSTPIGGLQMNSPEGPTPTTSQAVWNECLAAFNGAPLLFIAIDDADHLTDPGLGLLKTIAESRSPVPIILVVAAGPGLMARLERPHLSQVVRIFSASKFDLGELSRTETYDAITAPPKEAGVQVSWSEAARDRIYGYSHGYPYLVQCLAHSAFVENGAIDAPKVDATMDVALGTAGDWLAAALERPSLGVVQGFLLISQSGKIRLRTADMRGMGVTPSHVVRLVKAGVLKPVAHGQYDLVMAPLVAYYHAKKRGISL